MEITDEHYEKIKANKLKKYFEKWVKYLEELNYANPYPQENERYMDFVKHVYKEAIKYKIENVKYTYALILLWHVTGESFSKDAKMHAFLKDESVDIFNKYDILSAQAYDIMDEYEFKTKLQRGVDVSK
jgi:hypothetical protein